MAKWDYRDVNNYVMAENKKMHGWNLKKLKIRLKELEDSEEEYKTNGEELGAYGIALMESLRNNIWYQENQMRVKKRQSSDWEKEIGMLKDLDCDNENKTYTVFYKMIGQIKARPFQFHKVKYLFVLDSYEFVEFQSSIMGELTEDISDQKTLLDIEIESIKIETRPTFCTQL